MAKQAAETTSLEKLRLYEKLVATNPDCSNAKAIPLLTHP